MSKVYIVSYVKVSDFSTLHLSETGKVAICNKSLTRLRYHRGPYAVDRVVRRMEAAVRRRAGCKNCLKRALQMRDVIDQLAAIV